MPKEESKSVKVFNAKGKHDNLKTLVEGLHNPYYRKMLEASPELCYVVMCELLDNIKEMTEKKPRCIRSC